MRSGGADHLHAHRNSEPYGADGRRPGRQWAPCDGGDRHRDPGGWGQAKQQGRPKGWEFAPRVEIAIRTARPARHPSGCIVAVVAAVDAVSKKIFILLYLQRKMRARTI